MGWLVLLFRIMLPLCVLLFHFLSFSSSAASQSLCHPDQSSALLEFKNSFTISINNASYGCGRDEAYPKTRSWENGTDCCSWEGVTCDTMYGQVIGLDLSCSGLLGKIHANSTLFRLTHLHTLNLAYNDFNSSQLSSKFGGFVSLTHLNLSHSNFEGEIPSQISHLSKLLSLDLSLNDELKWKESTWKRVVQNATVLRQLVLDGTDMSLIMPSSLSLLLNLSSSLVTLNLAETGLSANLTDRILCLPNLQELDLSYNQYLQGQLPNLNCTSSLSILYLGGCSFQGSIPPSFSNLRHLTTLSLGDNQLNGSIPSSLLTLPRLSFLYLSQNDLSGQIPNVFHHSNQFQELDLWSNKIGGELPSSLSNLEHLISLDLSNNQFSGQIPSSLSNLQHLTDLDLSSNQFSGQIPDVLGELTKLQKLDLSNNNLGGQLPSSLFNLTQLSTFHCYSNKLEGLPNKVTGLLSLSDLDLSDNNLTGTIPCWCLSLPSLTDLDLSHNQFTSHIGVVSSHSLESLYLSNNKLQGNIPDSIFNLVNLTTLWLSSNHLSGPLNFQLFSNLQNLEDLVLSHNTLLSPKFESKVNYSVSRLIRLGLSSTNLTEFPNLSTKFPVLIYLDLSNNSLSGRVPNWLHEMDSLGFLNLSGNLFTSMDQFSANANLTYLDLSFNLLAGDISSSICNASSLGVLNLSHNMLAGTIPQCLANLSHLVALDLQMNKLHGTLPSTFSKTNKLKVLDLNGNQLEGPLPKSLFHCTELEFLNLSNNQIEDTFPHWLHTLQKLRVLVLRANKFHSHITGLKTKHPFPNLTIFDISSNNFSGPLPTALLKNFEAMMNVVEPQNHLEYMQSAWPNSTGYDSVDLTMKGRKITLTKILTTLVNIDLSKNNFEGEIPNVIGKLHALKGLNFSRNGLTGPIPQSMGSLTNLESLDLSSNMLTGEIPTELTNLNFLAVLNLSHNHLVGPIPQGKQFDTFSNDSYTGNLGLCGVPLSMKCNKDPQQHSPSSSPFQQEQGFGFGWKPVAIGYGCGMVFGMGCGCFVLFIGKPKWLVRMVGSQPIKRVRRRTRMRTLDRERVNELVQMS